MNISQENLTHHVLKIFIALVITAGVVATTIFVTRLLGPLPFSVTQTTTQKMATFDVTGESEIVSVPDEAQITTGIEVTASTVAAAQDQANEVINNIIASLEKLDIDKKDIQTQNYSVYPQYDYQNPGRPNITGYQVSANLRVKVTDFEKLNQVIDTSTQLGANQVGGIQFTMSEEKEEELTKQAREEAIEDAKEDAAELAGLAGIKLGKVLNVWENRGYQERPVFMSADMAKAENAMGGEPTQIEPGSSSFSYSVTLSYETL
jgi:uncharacterized protein